MDLYFCDICDESIPATDLDRGMAFRRGERVVCAACDSSMSPKPGSAEPDQPPSSGAPTGPVEGADAGGSPQEVASEPRDPKGGSSGLLWLTLFLGSTYLYMERERFLGVQAQQQASIEELGVANERGDQRFRDFQTTVSRADQLQASTLNTQVEKLSANSSENLANLRSRLGRLENSLESFRQEGVQDRQALGAEVRALVAEASAAQKSSEELAGAAAVLRDRVAAMEEILEGGLSLKDSSGRSGKAPTWAGTLADLKDASAGNRWTAVTALGDTRDVLVVPHLLPMLKDDDVFVRMATARVLGELGSLKAVGALIEALGDVQAAVREAAVVSLRLVTGKDFRFDPLGKEGDRAKAQSAWRKWVQQQGED